MTNQNRSVTMWTTDIKGHHDRKIKKMNFNKIIMFNAILIVSLMSFCHGSTTENFSGTDRTILEMSKVDSEKLEIEMMHVKMRKS